MEEMQIDVMQPHFALREGVEPGFLSGPIEFFSPIVDQSAHPSDVRTVRPGRPRRLIGEPRAFQAVMEIGDMSDRHR
jgi:hypothetical protein